MVITKGCNQLHATVSLLHIIKYQLNASTSCKLYGSPKTFNNIFSGKGELVLIKLVCCAKEDSMPVLRDEGREVQIMCCMSAVSCTLARDRYTSMLSLCYASVQL